MRRLPGAAPSGPKKEIAQVRYVYGVTAAILLGGAAATLSLNPVGAQTAQNDPGTIAAAAPRAGAPMSFADLAERLQPAVVNISTRQSVQVQQRRLPPGLEEFFRRFGAPVPEGESGGDGDGSVTQRGGSLGSGFIISPDGYIVTTITSSRRRVPTPWSSRSPSRLPTAPNMRPKWSAATSFPTLPC